MASKLPEYQSTVGLQRGSIGALQSGIKSTSTAQIIAEGVSKLADVAFDVKKSRDTTAMLKQYSDLQISATEYLTNLSVNGTGDDRDISQAAVEDFDKISEEFINSQPAYLRTVATEKMANLKQSVARSAIDIQAGFEAREVALQTKEFSNNISNSVRMGTMSESTGLGLLTEYAANLPANVRDEFAMEMSQSIRLASLNNIADSNPYAAIKAATSGAYNDLNPSQLQSVITSANSEIKAREAKAATLQKTAIERRRTDPYQSASLYLESVGIDPRSASDEQIEAAYDWAGVPQALRFRMSKDQANINYDQLKLAQNKQEFFATEAMQRIAYTSGGRPVGEYERAMTQLADAPPAIKALSRYNPNSDHYDASMNFTSDVLFDLVRDPDAGKKAVSQLGSIDKTFKEKISEATSAAIADYMATSGLSSSIDVSDQASRYFQDQIAVATMRVYQTDPTLSPSEAVEMAVEKIDAGSPTVSVVDGRNNFRVPKQYQEVITSDLLSNVGRNILESGVGVVISPSGKGLMQQKEVATQVKSLQWRSSDGMHYDLLNADGHSHVRLNEQTGRLEPITLTIDEMLLLSNAAKEQAQRDYEKKVTKEMLDYYYNKERLD